MLSMSSSVDERMEVESSQVTEPSEPDSSVANDHSPTRSCRALVLFLIDNVLSVTVMAPLVVSYWRGTWLLLDVYLLPDDKEASGWTCCAIGNIGLVCMVYLQTSLAIWVRVEKTLSWVIGYHVYTYVLGGLNVCQWRGVWNLLDYYTGVNVLSSWTTFAIGIISYITLLQSLPDNAVF